MYLVWFCEKIRADKEGLHHGTICNWNCEERREFNSVWCNKEVVKPQVWGLAKEYKLKPFVIKELSSDINVSLDFLEQHKIDQIHSQHCLRVQGKLVRLHDRRGPLPLGPEAVYLDSNTPEYLCEIGSEKVARKESTEVYVENDVVIPANSAKYIKLRVPKVQRGFMDPGDGLLTSCESFTVRNDIHPCKEAAVQVKKNGFVFIPVLNTLMHGVELRKNQKFGVFTRYTFKATNRERTKLKWSEKRIIEEFELDSAPALKSPADLKRAVKFIKQFGGLFSESNEDFGETDLIQHDIITDGSAPLKQKIKPVNPTLQENLDKQIDVWLKADIIEEANSPWNSRMLAVPKKDGRIRWVIDFRGVNSKTVKDCFPLPNIEECLSRMSNCKVFSAMDGTGAYHVVSVNPDHRDKTAFSCHRGQFQLKRLPFGLCNAPSTYSRLVNKVLEGLDRKYVANYLDDTCIFSKNLDEHFEQLERMFNAHRDAGLKLAPKKCQFFRDEIEFLGHVVSKDGIKTNPKNIEAIKKWNIETLEDLHTFVGKCIYYSNYVKDFTQKIDPLQKLLTKENLKNKKKKMLLTKEEQDAVGLMKQELTHAPILAYPDFHSKEPFILDTDWSHDPGAIGGVLSQVQDGKERVIAYGARKLRASEKAYSSNKGELLAVIHFMEKWKFYLWPRQFKLRTDHQALRWIYSMEVPSSMTTRWLQVLANHKFEVEFRKGINHGNADALSRARNILEIEATEDDNEEEQEILDSDTFVKLMKKDSLIQEALTWFDEGLPARSKYRSKNPDIWYYYNLFPLMFKDKGKIYVKWKTPTGHKMNRLCIPQRLQHMIIQQVHKIGHLGINNTTEAVKARYAFPSIAAKTEMIVNRCEDCQSRQVKLKDQKNTLVSATDGTPWQRVSVDIVEMKTSKYGNKYILTAKCCFTKWLEAIPMPNMTAKTVGNVLYRDIISRHGMMQQIHSDRGKQFVDKVFKEMCENFGILKTVTPAYNPKSNPVERSHRHLKACFKALKSTNEDWEDLLPSALLAIRTCVSKSTKITPFMAMYGREANLPIDIVFGDPPAEQETQTIQTWASVIKERLQRIYEFMRTNQEQAVRRSQATYTQSKLTKFKAGELVWLYTPKIDRKLGAKLSNMWSGPWMIQEKVSDVLYQIITHGKWNKKIVTTLVSVDRLQKYKSDAQHTSQTGLSAKDVKDDQIVDADEEVNQDEPDATEETRRTRGTLPERKTTSRPVRAEEEFRTRRTSITLGTGGFTKRNALRKDSIALSIASGSGSSGRTSDSHQEHRNYATRSRTRQLGENEFQHVQLEPPKRVRKVPVQVPEPVRIPEQVKESDEGMDVQQPEQTEEIVEPEGIKQRIEEKTGKIVEPEEIEQGIKEKTGSEEGVVGNPTESGSEARELGASGSETRELGAKKKKKSIGLKTKTKAVSERLRKAVHNRQERLVRGLEEKLIQRQEALERERIFKAAAKKELKEVEEQLKQQQFEMRGLEKDYKRMQGTHEQLWEAENKLRHKQSELELLEGAYVRLESEVHPNRPIRIPEEPPLQRFVRQYRQAVTEKRAQAAKRAHLETSSSGESTSGAPPKTKKQNLNTPSEAANTEEIRQDKQPPDKITRTRHKLERKEATKRAKPTTSSSDSTISARSAEYSKRQNMNQSPEHSIDMRSEASEHPNSESSKTSRTTTTARMSIQSNPENQEEHGIQARFEGIPRTQYDYPSDTSSESARSRASSDAMEATPVRVELKKSAIKNVASRLLGKRKHPPTSSSSSGSSSSECTKPPRSKKQDQNLSPLGSDTSQSDTQTETASGPRSWSSAASSTSSASSTRAEKPKYSKTTEEEKIKPETKNISGNGHEI